MGCEICGADAKDLQEVIFAGTRVLACRKCIREHRLTVVKRRVDKIRDSLLNVRRNTRPSRRVRVPKTVDYELVEDYGRIIKAARERSGLTQEDLARHVGVKLSYIKKVEQGKLVPELSIAKKLEKVLGVKILVEAEDLQIEDMHVSEADESGLTLGDYLKDYKE